MNAEERARQLHDRATRGLALSTEEQAELEAWYAEQDRGESILLGGSPPEQSLTALYAQLDEAMTRLRAVTARIHEIAAQNDALRREIAALQQQLAQALIVQAS
jgi:hypothetical protein